MPLLLGQERAVGWVLHAVVRLRLGQRLGLRGGLVGRVMGRGRGDVGLGLGLGLHVHMPRHSLWLLRHHGRRHLLLVLLLLLPRLRLLPLPAESLIVLELNLKALVGVGDRPAALQQRVGIGQGEALTVHEVREDDGG